MAEESRVLRISFVGDFSDVNAGLNRLEQRAGQPIAVGGAAAGASSAGGATIVNDSIPQSTSNVSGNVTIQSDTGGGFSVGGTFGGSSRFAGSIENAQRRQLRAAERLADATERQARAAESSVSRVQNVVNPAGNAVGFLRASPRNTSITPNDTDLAGAFADRFQANQYRKLFRNTVNDLNDPSSRVGMRNPSRASLRGRASEDLSNFSADTYGGSAFSPMGLPSPSGTSIEEDGGDGRGSRGGGGGRSQWGRLRRIATGGYAAYFGLETLSRIRDYNNANTLAGNNQSQQLENTQSLIGQIASVPFLGQAASLLSDPTGSQQLGISFAQQQSAMGQRIGEMKFANAQSRQGIREDADIASALPGYERDRATAQVNFEAAKRVAQARVRPLTQEETDNFESLKAKINSDYKSATRKTSLGITGALGSLGYGDIQAATKKRDAAISALNIDKSNTTKATSADVAAETADLQRKLDAANRDIENANRLAIMAARASGTSALLGATGTMSLALTRSNITSQAAIASEQAGGNRALKAALLVKMQNDLSAADVGYDTATRQSIIGSQNRGAVVALSASGQIHGSALRRIQNERQAQLFGVQEGPLANKQRRAINNEFDEENNAENTDFNLRNQADTRSLTDRRDELRMRAEGRDKSAQAREIADRATEQAKALLAPFGPSDMRPASGHMEGKRSFVPEDHTLVPTTATGFPPGTMQERGPHEEYSEQWVQDDPGGEQNPNRKTQDFKNAAAKAKLILEGGQAAEQNYLRELNLQALGRASSGQGIGLGGIGGGNNNSAQGQESVAKGIEGVKAEIAKLAAALLGIN